VAKRYLFTVQKKIVRIMVGAKPGNSCRGLLWRYLFHVFSLINFIVNEQDQF